jgi:hypothetical protein
MAKVSGHTHTQTQLNDYANQLNPNSEAYAATVENRANQLNQFHDAYWEARGLEPPDYSQLAKK